MYKWRNASCYNKKKKINANPKSYYFPRIKRYLISFDLILLRCSLNSPLKEVISTIWVEIKVMDDSSKNGAVMILIRTYNYSRDVVRIYEIRVWAHCDIVNILENSTTRIIFNIYTRTIIRQVNRLIAHIIIFQNFCFCDPIHDAVIIGEHKYARSELYVIIIILIRCEI